MNQGWALPWSPPIGDWARHALCRDHAHLDWHQTRLSRGAEHLAELERIRAVCDACPVRQDCLDHALRWERGSHSVWGGMTRSQRIRYARSSPRPSTPPTAAAGADPGRARPTSAPRVRTRRSRAVT